MTASQFDEILSRASVRLVHGKSPGLFVEGLTQDELAEIVTIAGRALGAIREDARINPAWLDASAKDWHFMFHREALGGKEPL